MPDPVVLLRPVIIERVAGAIPSGLVGADSQGNLILANSTQASILNPFIQNPSMLTQSLQNLGAAITPIYTVPNRKKAIVTGFFFNNQNVGANTGYINLNRGAVNARVSVQTTYATVQGGINNTTNCPFVFQAGDVIGVSASATDLNIKINILTFDASSLLFSQLTTTLATGDNTLYTVPLGKRFRNPSGNMALQPLSQLEVFYTNNSLGVRTVKFFHVPSGGTSIARNQLTNITTNPTNLTSTVADGGQVGVQYPFDLEQGDSIVMNLDANTASQAAYVTGYEYTP